MIEIGGKPILWHIMKLYSFYGVNDFIICCGYKGYMIKEYFNNYFLHESDITIDIKKNETILHQNNSEDWRVTLVDTGEKTMTGGRLKRVEKYLTNEVSFFFTYGDGLADINLNSLLEFHDKHGKLATLTATRPPGRYGALSLGEDDLVNKFVEKPKGDDSWINGGYFVLSPKVMDKISDDSTVWEEFPLKSLSKEGQLMAFRHDGFWQPMDTLREKILLEELWLSADTPWRVW
jgi:glucose-1-phosphate cytidylyltransferase